MGAALRGLAHQQSSSLAKLLYQRKSPPQVSHIPFWQDKWQLQKATSKNHNFSVTMATKLERALQGLLSKCGLEEDRQRENNTEWEKSWDNAAEDFFHSTAKVCGGWWTHLHTYAHKHTTGDLNFTPHWIIPIAELFLLWQIHTCLLKWLIAVV